MLIIKVLVKNVQQRYLIVQHALLITIVLYVLKVFFIFKNNNKLTFKSQNFIMKDYVMSINNDACLTNCSAFSNQFNNDGQCALCSTYIANCKSC